MEVCSDARDPRALELETWNLERAQKRAPTWNLEPGTWNAPEGRSPTDLLQPLPGN